jgi:hypothetical protein
MQSKLLVPAVPGECSGDCRVDGCSLERSAAHTCCCWQKHRQGFETEHSGGLSTQPAPIAELPKSGKGSCCLQIHGTHEESGETESVTGSEPRKKRTATIGSIPCGSGKLFALLNVETFHHLPFYFTEEIHSPAKGDLALSSPDRLISRYCDPPEPPPIIMIVS